MKKVTLLALVIFSVGLGEVCGQSDTTLVAKNLRLARQLAEHGLYNESISLLDDADRFDPTRTAVYSYEKGLTHYLKGDYEAAIRALSRATGFRDASDSVFAMLGDCCLETGEIDLAFEAYTRGLQKFPDSGPLYYRVGRIHLADFEQDAALGAFLTGIERDPACADNWYGAGATYLGSDDKVFGMVDAETAVCLDPGAELADLTRQALMESYLGNIFFDADPAPRVTFSVPARADRREETEDSVTPFPKVYETIIARAAAGETALDVRSLVDIRRRFTEVWFAEGFDGSYPCPLFDYHRTLIEAGHFEAYNYWLFAPVAPEVFAEWSVDNRAALDAFLEWFDLNPITVK